MRHPLNHPLIRMNQGVVCLQRVGLSGLFVAKGYIERVFLQKAPLEPPRLGMRTRAGSAIQIILSACQLVSDAIISAECREPYRNVNARFKLFGSLRLAHDSIGTDAVCQCHDGSILTVNSSYRPCNDGLMDGPPPPSWHAIFIGAPIDVPY